MPIGRPLSTSWSSGTLIAGEPVRFATAVNGVNCRGARRSRPSGSPGRTCRSSRAGPAARRASGRAPRRTARSTARSPRATPWSIISTPRYVVASTPLRGLVHRHRQRLDVLARRLAAGDLRAERRLRRDHRRPEDAELLDQARDLPRRVVLDHLVAEVAQQRRGSRRAPRGPAARPSTPSTGESDGQRDPQRARLLAGLRRERARARAVAQATSPSAWPASTSSASAVSRVVRDTTPSTPRNE